MSNELYGNYRQKKFTDIYKTAESFIADYSDLGIPTTITEENATTLFYLLYAQYGNSTIASSDTNQFKYKLFATVFMYGPSWEKELQIQNELRELTDEQLREGSVQLSQHGYNPSTQVNSNGEIETVDDQNKIRFKKSKIEGYANLLALLKKDVTKDFILKFKKLFLTIVSPELPLWYVSDVEEGE